MICFNCDYTEGAHPKILERLLATNLEQTIGYGEDPYCEQARTQIRKVCKAPKADVHFLVGGTQANFTVIRSALRPHQGVLCAATGHINAHESGAVEATGHKVLSLPCGPEGKLTADQVEAAWLAHWEDATHEHQVQPKMVYLSHPTENGALYTKKELTALSEVCKTRELFLFLDGARLGYGLSAPETDIALPDLARLCDAFYLGGTKCGALFGEAVVLTHPQLQADFRYLIKQGGGMLAKGRLLGLQFLTLMENGLYLEICGKANRQAKQIAAACEAAGFPKYAPSFTNQQFFIFPNKVLNRLEEKYLFALWERVDSDHTAVRICTSWATSDQNVEALIQDIQALRA